MDVGKESMNLYQLMSSRSSDAELFKCAAQKITPTPKEWITVDCNDAISLDSGAENKSIVRNALVDQKTFDESGTSQAVTVISFGLWVFDVSSSKKSWIAEEWNASYGSPKSYFFAAVQRPIGSMDYQVRVDHSFIWFWEACCVGNGRTRERRYTDEIGDAHDNVRILARFGFSILT